MSRVNTLLQAIVDQVKADADFSELMTVETHGGRFSFDEIKRLAKKAPCLLVSCLEIPALDDGAQGDNEHQLKIVMYVLTRDAAGVSKDISSVAIVEKALRHFKDEEWGFDWTLPAQNFVARNLYSNQIDKIGLSLWGIGFDQTIQLECC